MHHVTRHNVTQPRSETPKLAMKESMKLMPGQPAAPALCYPRTMADPSPFARLPLQRSESRSSLAPSSPLATQYPHVYHYVHNLFQSAASEAPIKEAHPLSVSSSTGSGSGSNSEDEKPKAPERKSTRTVSVSSNASAASTPSTDTQGSSKPSSEEKEETIRVIVDLLKDEKEEQVKDVLKQKLGPMGQVSG